MSALLTISVIVAGLVGLDVASIFWGADSRERPDSAEWERRRHWKGYR